MELVISLRTARTAVVTAIFVSILGFANAEAGVIAGRIYEADSVVHINDVEVAANDSLGHRIGSVLSSDNGAYTLSLNETTFLLAFHKGGYRDSTLGDVTVGPDDTLAIDMILYRSECHYLLGDANGSGVFNGIDLIYMLRILKGELLPLYTCECTPGNTWNVISDLNNSCSFNGLDITYGVEYFKGGADVVPCADCPGPNWWLRAWLVWGEDPRDLDFHLWTPPFGSMPSDSLAAHVCFYRRGSENEPPYALLQYDDVTSYGPEMIEVFQGFPGTYILAAYHYYGQGTIATSEARVSILKRDWTYTVMSVPQDSAGPNWWWHICAIDGVTGEVTPLNLLSPDPPRQDAAMRLMVK